MKIFGTVIVCVVLAGCALGPSEHSRRQYVETHYPNYEPESRVVCTLIDGVKDCMDWATGPAEAILNGKIMVGMSKDEVRASWGPPCHVTDTTWGDTWIYAGCGTDYSVGGTYIYFQHGKVQDFAQYR